MNRKWSCLGLICIFSLNSSVGLACQCGEIPGPVEAAKFATQVFVGEVFAIADGKDLVRIDEKTTAGLSLKVVYFRVRARIKGELSDEVSLVTGFSTCSFEFETNHTYLVYTENSPGLVSGRLTAKECLPNKSYESALDDLKALDAAGFEAVKSND